MGAVVRYLKDRGLQPGMSILDLYSTINAGRPGLYDRSDRPGATVASHVAGMGAHRARAQAFLDGSIAAPPIRTQGPDVAGSTPDTPTPPPISYAIDPNFDALSYEERGKLYDSILTEQEQFRARLFAARKDQLDADIESGRLTNRGAILNDISLDEGQRAEILRRFDERMRERAAQERGARKDAIDLGIETGSVAKEAQILDDDLLDGGEKAVLVRRLRERQKDVEAAERFDRLITTAPTAVTVDDREDFDRWFKGKAAPENLASDDPQLSAATAGAMFEAFRRTGMVAKSTKGALQTMVASKNPQKLIAGLTYLDSMSRQNAVAFEREFGAETAKLVDLYQLRLPYASPEQIVEEITKARDPSEVQARTRLRDEAEKLTKDYDAKAIADGLDRSIWPMTAPNPPADAPSQRRLEVEFADQYVQAFQQSGDAAQAERLALQRIGRVWGPSQLGANSLMRYPPERVYPSDDGTHEWLLDQVKSHLRAKGLDVEGKPNPAAPSLRLSPRHEPFVVATPETMSDWGAGRLPSYQLWVRDTETGMIDLVEPRWRWDVKLLAQKAEQRFEEARRKSLAPPDDAIQRRGPSAIDPIVPEGGEEGVYQQLFTTLPEIVVTPDVGGAR